MNDVMPCLVNYLRKPDCHFQYLCE